jgi:hypothetical protein
VVPFKDLVKGELHENTARKNFTVEEVVAIKRALEPKVRIGQGRRRDLTCAESTQVPNGKAL